MQRTASFKRRTLALMIGLSLLTGCARAISDCPPIVQYDQATRDRAADELATLPADSAIERMLSDYAQLRAEVKACR